MVGIGGDRGEGKARPVVFQEALFKLAAGWIERAERRSVAARIGPDQHALGATPGTAPLIRKVEAEMACRPEDLFFGLDLENAFGRTRRRDAFLEASCCSAPTA